MLPIPNLSPLSRRLCIAGVLAASLPAFAQTTPASGDNRAQATQEITVTAQKVAQPASKTPVSLSAVSGDELKAAGVNNAIDLAEAIPAVWISQDTGKAQIAIRGVTNTDMTEKGDGSAAFHIDGAYVGRPEAQLGGFYDLERVEVLRGPQGTLYGRNATAGAINVITNKPSKRFESKIALDFGNYSLRRNEAMINVPLGTSLALRAAVTTASRDTYLNAGPNTQTRLDSQSDYGGRLHLLANLTKDTSLLLSAEMQHTGGGGSSPVPITNFFTGTPAGKLPFSPAGRGNNVLNPVYIDRGSEAQRTTAWEFATVWRPGAALAGQPVVSDKDRDISSFRTEFKTTLGQGIDLTYQFANMAIDGTEVANGNFFGFPFLSRSIGDSESNSHELRLNGDARGMRWVAGAYVFDEKINRDTNFYTYVTLPNGAPLTVNLPFLPHVENESKAVFGQVTWSLMPTTRLTLGLRRTEDRKSGNDPVGGVAPPAGSSVSNGAYTKDVRFNNTSYRVGVDHDLAKDVMAFGTLSTGYKAGGFNDKANAGNYNPETLRSIELGIKGRFLSNRLQLAANVFDYDYQDLQLATVGCLDGTPASCGSVTINAAKAHIRGAEFEGWLNVGSSGRLNFGVALTDAKFKDYKVVDRPATNPNLVVDWSGQRLDKAPPITANLSYSQGFALPGGSDIVFTVGTRHTGKYFISTADENGIRYEQPASHKSDVSVTFNDAGGKWSLQGYVKNIEDTITIGSRVPGAFSVSDPRTFGVRATYTF